MTDGQKLEGDGSLSLYMDSGGWRRLDHSMVNGQVYVGLTCLMNRMKMDADVW